MYKKIAHSNVTDYGRVAVLCGGTSAEREVSLRSGEAVYQALFHAGVDTTKIDVQDAVTQLPNTAFDSYFIALHGVGGEDGKVQALLDLMGKRYTGSRHAASALAMNKLKTKQIFRSQNIPTPYYQELNADSDWQKIIDGLGGNAFVKPVLEGSSLGMSCVHSAEALATAYQLAATHEGQVIAEQTVIGREFTVTVLNGQALEPIELRTDHEFYDFDAKYISNSTQYLCPTNLSEQKVYELKRLAVRAFREVGCRGWGRVDFMQDAKGEFYALEVNTVPGMTDHSLVPMAAQQAGLSFAELVLEILEMAE